MIVRTTVGARRGTVAPMAAILAIPMLGMLAFSVDMSYLVYRELLYPLGDWVNKVAALRNQYAGAHHLPVRDFKFDWKEIPAAGASKPTADSSADQE